MATTGTGKRICTECELRTDARNCPQCKSPTIASKSFAQEEEAEALIGGTIAERYELTGILGRGGMGVVYSGLQLAVDRPVAIKVISQHLARDLQVVKRFQREAKVSSKLTHPNAIRVYDFGLTDEGLLYLVMELLEGRELHKEIKACGPMPVERAGSIAAQALKALHEAHGYGIVHRDLKPPNIFLQQVAGEKDFVKVMDFGIAKIMTNEGTSANLTQAGLIVGTPQYMSPEQVKGSDIDGRSDIYSLGVILFEMLCGATPFRSENPLAVLMMHTTEAPPAVESFRPDLAGHPIGDVVQRLLEKDPTRRPVSALHALSMLQKALPGTGTPISSPGMAGLDTGQFAEMESERKARIPELVTPTPLTPARVAAPVARPDPDEVFASEFENTRTMAEPGHALAEPPEPLHHPAPVIHDEPTSTEGSGADIDAPARPMWIPVAAAVAGVVLLSGAAVFALKMRSGVEKTPVVVDVAPPPAITPPRAAPDPPAEPAPANVAIHITSAPTGAQVMIDAKTVGVTPLDHPVPRGTQEIVVEVSREGFVTQSTKVVPDKDGAVSVTLAAVEKKAAPEEKKAASDEKRATRKQGNAKPKKKKGGSDKPVANSDLLEEL